LEEWQEIDNEADAGIVCQGDEEVEVSEVSAHVSENGTNAASSLKMSWPKKVLSPDSVLPAPSSVAQAAPDREGLRSWERYGADFVCVVKTFSTPFAHLPGGPPSRERRHTCMKSQGSRTQEQNINGLLLLPNLLTNIIHNANQAGVRFDKDIFPFRIQRLAFRRNAISSILRAADKISARLASMLCKLLERRCTDTLGGAHEDRDETRWEGGDYVGVGGLHGGEENHYGSIENQLAARWMLLLWLVVDALRGGRGSSII